MTMGGPALKPIATTVDEEVDESCGSNLGACMQRTLLDGAAIVLAYAVIVYVTDGKVLGACKIAKFYALFVALAFMFRFVGADLDQLTRVAGFQVGLKLFGVLT
jgi:hypothetical protein